MDDLDFGATIKGFSPGQMVFNRYKLDRILGRGGMGVVWLARDNELEREVALKFLPEVVVLDKEAVRDLKRETRRSLELTHPHIVRIHDFISDGRTAAISMEYIAGETVAARKVDHPAGRFEAAELQLWVRQLCEALAYAHTKGEVVHRDLKPANLMIDARGDLKIADFGIAASVSDSVSRVSAQAGSSGTPVYMSPQQMMGEKPAVTDDIYAAGATIYELLTGKPPFYSGNVMMQVQNKLPPSIAARRQELGTEGAAVPAEWEQTIAACLAKEAKDRPQSAREVAHRLGLGPAVTTAPFPVATSPAQPAAVATRAPAERLAAPTEASREGRDPKTLSPAKDNALGSKRSTSKAPLFVGIAAGVLMLAGVGYYFGAYAPEQKRQMEMKRLQDEGRAAEAAQLRTEKEKADATAKEKADAEQQAYAIMVAKIDSLLDGAPANQREATGKAVQDYLASVPARFRADIEGRWTKRLAGWEAYRLNLARGGFRIRTNPDGAEVQVGSLALEKSPLVKNDVRLGKYPVTIRAEGYEDWRGEVEVKENDFTDPGVITLVRSTGRLKVSSTPAGIDVLIDGTKARTPVEMNGVSTGAHELVFQRPGWPEVGQKVTVNRNEAAEANVALVGGSVEIVSTPAKAEVWANGSRVGVTPLTLQDQPPGITALELRLKGYASAKTTREFIPGRPADKWAATLKPGGVVNGRPDFLQGPAGMRTKLTVNNSGGFKLQTTVDSEAEFSGPRRDGSWSLVTEKILSYTTGAGITADYSYVPGTTLRYERTPAGDWPGRLVSGNFRNGKYEASYDKYLSLYNPLLWVMFADCWPQAEAGAGAVWQVPLTEKIFFLGRLENVRGSMTGYLKKITDEVAEIEYKFDLMALNTNANTEMHYTGTLQTRVNLAEKYAVWCSLEYHFEGTQNKAIKLDTTLVSEVISVTPRSQ